MMPLLTAVVSLSEDVAATYCNAGPRKHDMVRGENGLRKNTDQYKLIFSLNFLHLH